MEWIEVTGRTIEDAKELALDRLGVVEDELEFEVLEEGKKGLLGIGRTEARIRARVKPLSREKPGDRRRRRSRAGAGEARGRSRREREPAGARTGNGGSDTPKPSRRGRRGAGAASAPAPAAAETTGAVDETESGDGAQVPPRPARRRRKRSSTTTTAVPVAQEEHTVEEEISIEEQATAANRFTVGFIDAFGVDAHVRTEVRDDAVHVLVEGDNLGLLVGPRGATLAALEEVVRAVVQRSSGGHSARVHVDVGGYRERRREALAEFARRVAAEVKNEGVERALEPMGAPDRKVVHDTVAEIEGVTTSSEGEESRRHVVIRPA